MTRAIAIDRPLSDYRNSSVHAIAPRVTTPPYEARRAIRRLPRDPRALDSATLAWHARKAPPARAARLLRR